MADTDREPANQDSQQRAALFRDMLLDALHAMRSMDDMMSMSFDELRGQMDPVHTVASTPAASLRALGGGSFGAMPSLAASARPHTSWSSVSPTGAPRSSKLSTAFPSPRRHAFARLLADARPVAGLVRGGAGEPALGA